MTPHTGIPLPGTAAASKGMTLVEMLVASVIGTILAGIVIMIYLLFDAQIKEDNAYLTMQMQYENLSEQIAFTTRGAHKIFDAAIAFYDTCEKSEDTVTAVRFFDPSGTLIGGVRIMGDTVMEMDANGAWIPFQTGNGVVCTRSGSTFVLDGCRNGISLNLTLKNREGDSTYYLAARKDHFLCRN